jgi:hypothetical protein
MWQEAVEEKGFSHSTQSRKRKAKRKRKGTRSWRAAGVHHHLWKVVTAKNEGWLITLSLLCQTPPMILLCSQGMEFVQRYVENVAPTSKYHLYGASALATAASSGSHLSPLASNFSLLYNSSSLVSVAYSALGPRSKTQDICSSAGIPPKAMKLPRGYVMTHPRR